MRPYLLLAVLSLALVAPALAEEPATRARALVTLSGSPEQLRAALLAYADSATAAGDAADAGEALGYVGQSLQRESRVDSAIACYRRALVQDRREATALSLTDLLLLRRRGDDVAAALRLLEVLPTEYGIPASAQIQGRVAWGYFLLGRADTAQVLLARVSRALANQPEWRYRMARIAIETGDLRHAADLLLPEAVRSRGTDDEIVGLLDQVGGMLSQTERLKQEMRRRVGVNDRRTLAMAGALGGQLVTFTASDGFTVGGLLVRAAETPSRRPPRLAIVLLAPPDSLGAADSLAIAFHAHGLTTLLLFPRGSGLSVGASCPSPEAWFGRETFLRERVARDVVEATRWARSAARVDTTRFLVAGVGSGAAAAIEAATLEPRVRALLLVSPAPALVDRGEARARIARLQLPVFYQVAADDLYPALSVAEMLYQAGNHGASRVVESHMSGSGLAQFRDEPALARRFLAWLDATFSAPTTSRPATPRGSRR